MNLILSLISGMLAAFSPCVIILIPLLLFRFVNKEKIEWSNLLLLIAGFLVSYVLFAYFLSSIFTSSIQNGVKLGAGLLFIVLGVLSWMKRTNPFNFPLIKNPFLFGVFFALIISFNPCTIPFLSVVVALNTTGMVLANMIFFALGLLTPTVLFTLFGQSFLNFAKKGQKFIVIIDKLMNFILIGSGIYLVFTIRGLHQSDVYAAIILLVLVFVILIKSFFVLNTKKDLFKLKNILLVLSLLLIIIGIAIHCNNQFSNKVVLDENDYFGAVSTPAVEVVVDPVCSLATTKNCTTCYNCISLFFIAIIVGAIGIMINKKIK